MNSAMVFCTSYFQDKTVWDKRYRRWLDYNAKLFPDSKLFMIDDGSPYRPTDVDVRITMRRLAGAIKMSPRTWTAPAGPNV